MTEKIPPKRLFAYIILLSLLPTIFIFFTYFSHKNELIVLNDELEETRYQAELHQRQQKQNVLTRQFYQDSDLFYLDKYVETLPLLENEHKTLLEISEQASLALDPKITQRIEFLNNNVLMFSEGAILSYPFFKEIPEMLARPVEVDIHDIRKILAKIEGVKIGSQAPDPKRPQFIITEFKLDKKNTLEGSQTFLLNLKFIKREFTQ